MIVSERLFLLLDTDENNIIDGFEMIATLAMLISKIVKCYPEMNDPKVQSFIRKSENLSRLNVSYY